MKPFTLIMPYYENPGMLRKHLETWEEYPGEWRKHLAVIVVDDGSPTRPAADVFTGHIRPPKYFSLYRIKVDVRWNWLACRNLAMSVMSTKWGLMTDIDHLMPKQTLRALIVEMHDQECVYRLSRRNAPGSPDSEGGSDVPYKAHPNTWFMTKRMFDRIGGYDERFSGFYGSDADFRERTRVEARQVIMLSDYLYRYPRAVIPDASTTTYGRKEVQDGNGIAAARERIAREGGPPLRLSFPWEQLI